MKGERSAENNGLSIVIEDVLGGITGQAAAWSVDYIKIVRNC